MIDYLTLPDEKKYVEKKLWVVRPDNEVPDWGKPRTMIVKRTDGTFFSQLPAVYGYAWEPIDKPDNYRVNEEWLRTDYIRINNYDGMGIKRCENYLWKDNTALYNGKAFPYREMLTMTGNLLQEIDGDSQYLIFKTLRPNDDVSNLTFESNPELVHRFTLVTNSGYTTNINQWYKIYYYLVSPTGIGYMPKRYVKLYSTL